MYIHTYTNTFLPCGYIPQDQKQYIVLPTWSSEKVFHILFLYPKVTFCRVG